MDNLELKILLIGLFVFMILPIFWLYRSDVEKKSVKRKIILKIPLLGALMGLAFLKNFGEPVVWGFYLLGFVVQFSIIMKGFKWGSFAE